MTFASRIAIGQTNLVPNPGFENVSLCPFALGLEAFTTDWKTARASPDYFNTCSTASIAGVPNNSYGYQQPNSGNAYIGMITYRADTSVFTEAASVQLITPLSVGQTYYVSFKASLTLDPINNEVMAANNKIGVQFSKTGYSPSSQLPINNYAHVWTDSIITDTLNWTLVKGIFIADSNYTHLSIGNFFDKQYIDSIVYTPTFGAYYYFDDVCVSSDPNYCYPLSGIDKYKIEKSYLIYPNPTSTYINIRFRNLDIIDRITISDQLGNVIIQKTSVDDGIIELNSFLDGLYFIEILSSGRSYYDKIIVRH
ncbi:MAG: T9SS type A sorting domain-containing protein [Bacteroidia bacterium]|nr:T9SS type A sorting domain-containing protein [Bacteroidia bacterium]